MPYTGNPAGFQADEVRLLIGDTSTTNPMLSDDEVAYFMGLPKAQSGGTCISVRAAWLAVQALIAKYARMMSVTVGPTTVNYSELVTSLQTTSKVLEQMGGKPGAMNVGAPIDKSSTKPAQIGDSVWRNSRVW
jgi:hypothetical protein